MDGVVDEADAERVGVGALGRGSGVPGLGGVGGAEDKEAVAVEDGEVVEVALEAAGDGEEEAVVGVADDDDVGEEGVGVGGRGEEDTEGVGEFLVDAAGVEDAEAVAEEGVIGRDVAVGVGKGGRGRGDEGGEGPPGVAGAAAIEGVGGGVEGGIDGEAEVDGGDIVGEACEVGAEERGGVGGAAVDGDGIGAGVKGAVVGDDGDEEAEGAREAVGEVVGEEERPVGTDGTKFIEGVGVAPVGEHQEGVALHAARHTGVRTPAEGDGGGTFGHRGREQRGTEGGREGADVVGAVESVDAVDMGFGRRVVEAVEMGREASEDGVETQTGVAGADVVAHDIRGGAGTPVEGDVLTNGVVVGIDDGAIAGHRGHGFLGIEN